MKLSDIERGSQRGIEVSAKIFPYVLKMLTNKEVNELRKSGTATISEVLSAMIANEQDAALKMYAAINGVDYEEYKNSVSAGDMLNNMFETLTDDDLMILFGLRERKTEKASSTPATENTGANGKAKKQ